MPVRTVVERGPKGKRSVAFRQAWPGWRRSVETAGLALETLEAGHVDGRPSRPE